MSLDASDTGFNGYSEQVIIGGNSNTVISSGRARSVTLRTFLRIDANTDYP